MNLNRKEGHGSYAVAEGMVNPVVRLPLVKNKF